MNKITKFNNNDINKTIYYIEAKRLNTFQYYRCNDKGLHFDEKLKRIYAMTGLYSTYNKEEIKCAFCHFRLVALKAGDTDPVQLHYRFQSACPLYQFFKTKNEPIDEELLQISLRILPFYPKYKTLAQRFNTFEYLIREHKINNKLAKALANNGFFSQYSREWNKMLSKWVDTFTVICFYCCVKAKLNDLNTMVRVIVNKHRTANRYCPFQVELFSSRKYTERTSKISTNRTVPGNEYQLYATPIDRLTTFNNLIQNERITKKRAEDLSFTGYYHIRGTKYIQCVSCRAKPDLFEDLWKIINKHGSRDINCELHENLFLELLPNSHISIQEAETQKNTELDQNITKSVESNNKDYKVDRRASFRLPNERNKQSTGRARKVIPRERRKVDSQITRSKSMISMKTLTRKKDIGRTKSSNEESDSSQTDRHEKKQSGRTLKCDSLGCLQFKEPPKIPIQKAPRSSLLYINKIKQYDKELRLLNIGGSTDNYNNDNFECLTPRQNYAKDSQYNSLNSSSSIQSNGSATLRESREKYHSYHSVNDYQQTTNHKERQNNFATTSSDNSNKPGSLKSIDAPIFPTEAKPNTAKPRPKYKESPSIPRLSHPVKERIKKINESAGVRLHDDVILASGNGVKPIGPEYELSNSTKQWREMLRGFSINDIECFATCRFCCRKFEYKEIDERIIKEHLRVAPNCELHIFKYPKYCLEKHRIDSFNRSDSKVVTCFCCGFESLDVISDADLKNKHLVFAEKQPNNCWYLKHRKQTSNDNN